MVKVDVVEIAVELHNAAFTSFSVKAEVVETTTIRFHMLHHASGQDVSLLGGVGIIDERWIDGDETSGVFAPRIYVVHVVGDFVSQLFPFLGPVPLVGGGGGGGCSGGGR